MITCRVSMSVVSHRLVDRKPEVGNTCVGHINGIAEPLG